MENQKRPKNTILLPDNQGHYHEVSKDRPQAEDGRSPATFFPTSPQPQPPPPPPPQPRYADPPPPQPQLALIMPNQHPLPPPPPLIPQPRYNYIPAPGPPPPGVEAKVQRKGSYLLPDNLGHYENLNKSYEVKDKNEINSQYYTICMICFFICFLLALACCILAGVAYHHDNNWNKAVRSERVLILSTDEARETLREIYGLNWKNKLQRTNKALICFIVIMAVSAAAFLFHVWLYQAEAITYYRTTITLYLHFAGLVADLSALLAISLSLHDKGKDAKVIDQHITEYFNTLVVPRPSALLAQPGFSYFHYCPATGDYDDVSEEIENAVSNMSLCQDATCKIIAIALLLLNMVIYMVVILATFCWLNDLAKVKPEPQQQQEVQPSETTEEITMVTMKTRKGYNHDPNDRANFNAPMDPRPSQSATATALPKMDYLTLGFHPATSYQEPPDNEPVRPEIVHVSRSSTERLAHMHHKIKRHSKQ